MPRVEATATVPLSPELAFAVSQSFGPERARWDNFVRSQHHLHGATAAGPGVQTLTISRHRIRMVSEYASFKFPQSVGMRMVQGPWFFAKFGGGWLFKADAGQTKVTWRYTFSTRPAWLKPIAERIGVAVLQRDIERRLNGFVAGCQDPIVINAAKRNLANWDKPEGSKT